MGGAHVLVVDDDGYFRNSVADALYGLGYRVSRVEDVPMALAVLRTQSVDVVVADHVMPGLSGLVLFTEHDPASVFRFIEKPFDPVAIRLAVRSAVDDLERERRERRMVDWVRGRPDLAPAELFA
jgi:DNA-binding NtrC family response regulator